MLPGKWTEEEEKRLAEVVHELISTEPGDIVTQGVSWAAVRRGRYCAQKSSVVLNGSTTWNAGSKRRR